MQKRIACFIVTIFIFASFCLPIFADTSEKNSEVEIVGTYESEYEKELKRVNDLVKPSIVYGTIRYDISVFKKGEKAEIVCDRENGKSYQLRKNGNTYWVSAYYVSVPSNPATNTEQMTKEDIELYVNSKDFKSSTDYLIWIDIDRQLLHTFLGEKGNWHLFKTVPCATGNNRTPTIRGLYTVYAKGYQSFIKGDCWVKNYLRFNGAYMIHSNPVNGKGRITDYTMGRRVSNGCVRTNMSDSEWLLYYVPNGTLVYTN